MRSRQQSRDRSLTHRNTPRQRSQKACDQCRRRKEKCIGRTPPCDNCHVSGRQCTYNLNSKRRGLPEGWVKTLERLWALACLTVPDLEQMIIDAVERGLSPEHQDAFSSLWIGNSPGTFLNNWRTSMLARELQNLLPRLETLPNSISDPLTSEACNDLLDQYRLSWFDTVHAPRETGIPPPLVSSDRPPCLHEVTLLPGNHVALTEAYWTRVQCWLPILDKQHIHHICYRWSDTGQVPENADLACLYSIFALGSPEVSAVNGQQPDLGSSHWFARQARSLLSVFDISKSMTHIQALLILVLYDIEGGRLEEAWLSSGKALRATTMLRALNRPIPPVQTSTFAVDGVQRLMLASKTVENILAANFRVGLETGIEIGNIGRLNEDTFEEWQPSTTNVLPREGYSPPPSFCISTFNSLAELSGLLCKTVGAQAVTMSDMASLDALRQVISKAIEARPSHLRWDTFKNLVDVSQASPPQYTIQLIHHLAIYLTFRHDGTILAEESQTLRRLGDLLLSFSARFHVTAIPSIWQPILSITVEHFAMKTQNQTLARTISVLLEFSSTAAKHIPSFKVLENRIRLLSHDQESINNDNGVIGADLQDVLKMPPEEIRRFPGTLEQDFYDEMHNDEALQGRNMVDLASTSSQQYIVNGYDALGNNLGNEVQGLLAIDTLTWGETQDSCFENLGFIGSEFAFPTEFDTSFARRING